MQVTTVNEKVQRLAPATAAGPHLAFAQHLTSAMAAKVAASVSEGEARQAAEQLVATTFVQPLLRQMRQDPLRSELMHGGLAEDAFSAQLDTQLADRIVRRTHWPLVDRIVQSVMGGRSTAVPPAAEVRA